MSYLPSMHIAHQKVIGENGRPEAALVPWDVFVQIQHQLEDEEPTTEECAAMARAARDRAEGNTEAFIGLDQLKSELSI